MRNLGKASLTGTMAFLIIGGGLAACEVSTTVIPLDGSVPDASNDSTTTTDAPVTNDGGTDAPTTDGDAGGYTPESLKTLLDKTLCDRVQVCCGNKGFNGAPFDRAKCATNLGGGFENVTEDLGIPGVSAANITVDQAKASKCANDLQLLTCINTTGAPSTEYKQAIADCYGALIGKVAANGACHGDVECVKGTYCDGAYTPGTPDVRTGTYVAGGGTCKPLKALGAACVVTDKGWGDNCSNRGTGDTGNYCDLAAGKCAPLLAATSPCQNNLACASSTCEYVDTNPPLTPTTCGTKTYDPFICDGF